MKHWAYDHIGKPYTDGKDGMPMDGPDTFNCWGFVRYIFRTVRGVEMPLVHIDRFLSDDAANRVAIREVFSKSGWRPVKDLQPQEFDIALTSNVNGRHVGIASHVNDRMHLIHAIESEGVSAISFADLWMLGYCKPTYWRYQA